MTSQEPNFNQSSQFIQMKVNLYSAFESEEESSVLALKELVKWPENENLTFPTEKFDKMLEKLTQK